MQKPKKQKWAQGPFERLLHSPHRPYGGGDARKQQIQKSPKKGLLDRTCLTTKQTRNLLISGENREIPFLHRFLLISTASKKLKFWLRGQDLNLRPSGYEPDELPSCSTPRLKLTFANCSSEAANYRETSICGQGK
jgi:hypothetical protein